MFIRAALLVVSLGALCYAQGEKAQSWGFVGMRGKKDVGFEQNKRGPSSLGFQGVRGKKDGFDPFENEIEGLEEPGLEFEKRGPALMGFQGVRGKKDDNKRAPSGFMGMRGKKDDYYPSSWLYEEDKRAPSGFFGVRGKKGPSSSSFFGMRGKKGPSSGFFGMRGKKGPSGFMGVRGKKSLDIDGLIALLRDAQIPEDLEDVVAREKVREMLEENDE